MKLFPYPVYDIDELFLRNFHIHTCLSRCGKKEMTVKAIVDTAYRAGLTEIALTDHIHPGETWKLSCNLPKIKSELDLISSPVRVYVGAELSAYGVGAYTHCFSEDNVQYRLFSHNHYHMFGWHHPEDTSPNGYKEHIKAVITSVVSTDTADALAHPFSDYYIVREVGEKYGFSLGDITGCFSENELGDILTLCKHHATGIELNTSVLFKYPDFAPKLFHIGKEVGVTFYPGTDAHRLSDIDPAPRMCELKKLLNP